MDLKIIICGVGGQGVLYFAKNLYALAVLNATHVLGSETHGMSQRGGSVVSHVKIGDYASPMVQQGTADLLFSLRAEETYHHLTFLRNGGRLVINADDRFVMDPEIAAALKAKEITVSSFDASGVALSSGLPAATNIILLAHALAAGFLPFSLEQLRDAVKSVTAPGRVEASLTALEAGAA